MTGARDFHVWAKGLELFSGAELILAYTAQRAYPVFGQVFESRASGNAIVGVTYCGVILVATNVTYVLFHSSWGFGVMGYRFWVASLMGYGLWVMGFWALHFWVVGFTTFFPFTI